MRHAAWLLAFAVKFGGLGLLVLGVLDSSFLFAPWGNDLLVVALTARHRDGAHMLYYAAMSTLGSALGCLLIDVTMRPLGAKGLERYLPAGKVKRVESKVRANAGQALAVASLVPPPFPFTAFVMAAAALQYARTRLLAVVTVTRMIRFTLLGLLAMRFGERILKWSKNPVVEGFLIAIIVVSTVGSVISVYVWIRRGRSSSRGHRSAAPRLKRA